MKFLFFSPVGASSVENLPDVVGAMLDSGGDVALAVYDDWVPEGNIYRDPRVTIIHERGQRKWQIARKHFNPEKISAYDYIFLWDDDLQKSDFEPIRFLRIMAQNELNVAQPSILSPYPITHPITRQRACGKILPDGRVTVGRFTNFVEIMAPVYSKKGWSLIYPYLDDSNPEAFGYDFVPVGRAGIIDCMHVIHLRPTRTKSYLPFHHQNLFNEANAFAQFAPTQMGSLKEMRETFAIQEENAP